MIKLFKTCLLQITKDCKVTKFLRMSFPPVEHLTTNYAKY